MRRTKRWWERPQRMLRHDFLDDFSQWNRADLRRWAREKKQEWKVSLEWIHGTTGSWPGNAHLVTFDSGRFEKVPGLEIDLPRSYVPAAHKEGLRVIAYVNCHWYSRDFAAAHPDWEQRLQDGRGYGEVRPLYGSGTSLCPNSSWRDWFFGLVDELMATGIDGIFLDGPAMYPGCCYCDACRKQFRSRHGADLPRWEDWSDPVWKQFIEFRIESIGRFLSDVVRLVHQRNPDAVCFMNSGGWRSREWRVGRSVDYLAKLQDISGAEAFFHPANPEETAWDGYVMGKVQSATGKPSVVFFHHAVGSWHYEPLPMGEAMASAVQAAATGSSVWFGVFNPAVKANRERTVGPISKAFQLVERIHSLTERTLRAAKVAVLLSKSTARYYISQVEGLYVDPRSGAEIGLMVSGGEEKTIAWTERKRWLEELCDDEFFGTCLALGNEHIPFDVVHEAEPDLSRYRVVILPNAACLREDLISQLLDWVRKGGTLLMSFESGRYDQIGELRDLWQLGVAAGIRELCRAWRPRSYEEYLTVGDNPLGLLPPGALLPRPPHALKMQMADDADVLVWFMNETSHRYRAPQGRSHFPAVTVRQYGRGKIVYLACLLGAAVKTYRLPVHEMLVGGILRAVAPEAVPVATKAPRGVWIDVRKAASGEFMLVQFLNRVASPGRPSDASEPTGPFEVKLKGVRAKEVRAVLAGRSLPFSNDASGCSLLVETMPAGEWVVVETG